jgi:hypothetical protein
MFKHLSLLIVVAFAILLLFLQDNVQAQSRSALQSFKKSTTANKNINAKIPQSTAIKGGGKSIKFEPIQPIVHNGTTYQSGVKIWFELADGSYVDPTKHKWQRRERFKIWFESPMPAIVALYQNYPHDQLKSTQRYPDSRWADSFNVLPAGVPTVLPVDFVMDDDLEDELMSIILTRADNAEILPQNDSSFDININTDNLVVGGDMLIGQGGSMKGLKAKTITFDTLLKKNREILALPKKSGTKFEIFIEGGSNNASQNPDDVAVVVLGVGPITQVQFTLHKD